MYSGYSFRSRYIVRVLRKLGCEVAVMTSARHDGFEVMEESIDDIRHFRTQRPAGALDRMQLLLELLELLVSQRELLIGEGAQQQPARDAHPDRAGRHQADRRPVGAGPTHAVGHRDHADEQRPAQPLLLLDRAARAGDFSARKGQFHLPDLWSDAS